MKTSKAQKSLANPGSGQAPRTKSQPQDGLVSSPAEAKRESATLRRERENLESDNRVDETDIRTSLP
ncbi:MAG: hypothetical protein ABI273_04935 [Lacunisphaera sp.]